MLGYWNSERLIFQWHQKEILEPPLCHSLFLCHMCSSPLSWWIIAQFELFFFSNIPSLGLIFHSSLETFGLVRMLLNYAILNFVMGAGLDDFFYGMQLVGWEQWWSEPVIHHQCGAILRHSTEISMTRQQHWNLRFVSVSIQLNSTVAFLLYLQ